MKKLRTVITATVIFLLAATTMTYAGYSYDQRQTGEAVLDELFAGTKGFLIRARSGGCTKKDSFKVDVKKDEGKSSELPHYLLTVKRIETDECKANLYDGALFLFDIGNDLGIKGNFTYSVTNPVYSPSRTQKSDESLWSIIEKHFTINFPEIKEIRPEPYEKFVMDRDYFACLIPVRWKLQRDKEGDEKAGIFEIKLTMPDKAKPEDGEKYFVPDPLIYAGFYSANNDQKKTYESFVAEYERLYEKRQGSDKSSYEKPKDIKLNGRDAKEYAYEVYQDMPRGPLFSTKYWLKAKFIVMQARDGFYVLAYKSPKEFYDDYLPVFEEVFKSFKPMD